MSDTPRIDGMVPDALLPRRATILLEDLEVQADIGFHQFEVGSPQRLLVTVEVLLDDAALPDGDAPANAWDYDLVRTIVRELASARRYNLQETLAHAIYLRVAALKGVAGLRVRTSKPDVYPDTRGVGIEYSSLTND